MSPAFVELEQIRLVVDDAVRETHLAGISRALRKARKPGLRRVRLLAVTAALVLLLPVVALAARNTVPGDVLYPVKLMLEPVVGLFDGDVAIDHRVEEVEELVDRQANVGEIRDQLERARRVVTPDYPDYEERLDRVADRLSEREGLATDDPGSADGVDDTEQEPRDVTGNETDGTTQPGDSAGDEQVDQDRITTTTLRGTDRTTIATDTRRTP